MSRRKTIQLVAALWTIILIVGCFIPGGALPNLNIPNGQIDKLAHFALFFGFAVFWTLARPRNWMLIGVVGVVLGGAIELIQAHLPWPRSAEWGDFVADVLGVGLGLVVGLLLGRWADKGQLSGAPRVLDIDDERKGETASPTAHKTSTALRSAVSPKSAV